jgi:LSD1 subclass zinc finger protein
MRVFFTCYSCRQPLSIPDWEAGEQVRCPRCHANLHAPVLPPTEAVPVPQRVVPRNGHPAVLRWLADDGAALLLVSGLALFVLVMLLL